MRVIGTHINGTVSPDFHLQVFNDSVFLQAPMIIPLELTGAFTNFSNICEKEKEIQERRRRYVTTGDHEAMKNFIVLQDYLVQSSSTA